MKADNKKAAEEAGNPAELVRSYAIIAAVIVVLALLSFLLVPRGTGFKRCAGIIISQYKYECIESLAINSSNYSACSYLPAQPGAGCYASIAFSTRNATICTRIVNQSELPLCVFQIANSTGSYSSCDVLSGGSRSQCMLNIAVISSNTVSCGRLGNATDEDICLSSISLAKAMQSENGTYCNNVTNASDAGATKEILRYSSAIYLNGSNQSRVVYTAIAESQYNQSQPINARDACYAYIATESANTIYCGDIKDAEYRTACYSSYYRQSLNISGTGVNGTGSANNISTMLGNCSQSSGSYYGSTCQDLIVMSEAVHEKNATICTKFAAKNETYQCYTTLAMVYNDSSYCSYIQNATINSACVMTSTHGYSTPSSSSS